MKTKEKVQILEQVMVAMGVSKEQVLSLWNKDVSGSSNTIESIFPVVYKKEKEFEVLPCLDLNRKAEVWGYEILPGIILAKKCGCVGNVENTNWGNSKAFAEKCKLNGKKGSLPSKEVLKENWSKELVDKIRAMDKFLVENGVDAETRSEEDINYVGILWCSEVNVNLIAYCFNLEIGVDSYSYKDNTISYDRLAVAFS